MSQYDKNNPLRKKNIESVSVKLRRKQYKFQNSRSQSAPSRKKKWWLQKGESFFGFGKNYQG